MSNKRELAGLSSDLGGYWGQEEEIAKKAKKNNTSKKTGAKKQSTASSKAATLPSYTITQKTHEEAGFYGGDLVRDFVPKTELGDKVDKFLYWVFSEEEEGNTVEYGTKDYMKEIEKAGNDEIASFFVPLDQSYMGSLSFFQGGGGTFAMCMADGLKNEEGSAVAQMKAFAKWYAENDHYYGHRVKKLDWLIKKLEAKHAH